MNKIRKFGKQFLMNHPKINPYKFTKENNPVRNIIGYITSDLRSLPSFIIIGTMLCGSTSLHYYVRQHPKISTTKIEGSNYFTNNFEKGIKSYRSQFPILKGNTLSCETSVDYLPSKIAPKRILKTMPNCKFLVIFRNPVDRAYSHYINELLAKRLDVSFEQALEIEKTGNHSNSKANFNFVKQGLYEQQLREWYRYFPKEQFHLIKSEVLMNDTTNTMNNIFKFVGLFDYKISATEKKHVQKYDPMNAKTRDKLAEVFKEPNKKLTELTGIDFNWK